MRLPFSERDPAVAKSFVAGWEGCRLVAYKDVAGVMTIGYGHTGREVFSGLVISQELADEWLVDDLERHAAAIAPSVKVPVTQNQYVALLSFAFNVGAAAFKRSSVLKNLNAGAPMQAAESFRLWVKAGGKTVNGLVRRRAAERKLFLTPDED